MKSHALIISVFVLILLPTCIVCKKVIVELSKLSFQNIPSENTLHDDPKNIANVEITDKNDIEITNQLSLPAEILSPTSPLSNLKSTTNILEVNVPTAPSLEFSKTSSLPSSTFQRISFLSKPFSSKSSRSKRYVQRPRVLTISRGAIASLVGG